MDGQPRVSIVLPTYNQANYLAAALGGVINQTFRDFELIVVNDGSTDETSQVLAKYRAGLDFQLIEQENQGLPRALNVGFAHASGNYLTWTSSDNIMLPSMLDVLAAGLDSDFSVGVVYADWYFIDETGQSLGLYRTIDYDRHLLLRYNYVHCCFLFRRECIDRVGGYDPDYVYSEDWEFWIRVSRCFNMKHIPQALYLYRVHPRSMTTKILEGTACVKTSYEEFAAHLRRQSPFAWYYSKLKWKLLTLRLGHDPWQAWKKILGTV